VPGQTPPPSRKQIFSEWQNCHIQWTVLNIEMMPDIKSEKKENPVGLGVMKIVPVHSIPLHALIC
jgi:hypothetical protein